MDVDKARHNRVNHIWEIISGDTCEIHEAQDCKRLLHQANTPIGDRLFCRYIDVGHPLVPATARCELPMD